MKPRNKTILRDVATIERQSIQPTDIADGTLFVGLEHILESGTFSRVAAVAGDFLKSTKFCFDDRHILYGKLRPYLRKIARPGFSGICSTDILPILPHKEIDRDYLFHYLRSAKLVDLATARSTGANLPRLSPKSLEEFPVPLPPLEEQRKIAAVLDKAGGLMREHEQMEALLRRVRAALVMHFLGDLFVNEKNWTIVSLQDISRKITDGVHHKPDYTESGIPFISVKDIVTGALTFANCKFISEQAHDKLIQRCQPELNDVLYTKVGVTYGVPALVDTGRPFSLYVSVCLIKPEHKVVNPIFLREILRTRFVKQQADKSIKGIGVPDLHLNEIKRFQIPLPPLEVQSELARAAAKIDNLTQLFAQSRSVYNKMENSLERELFSLAADASDLVEVVPCQISNS